MKNYKIQVREQSMGSGHEENVRKMDFILNTVGVTLSRRVK